MGDKRISLRTVLASGNWKNIPAKGVAWVPRFEDYRLQNNENIFDNMEMLHEFYPNTQGSTIFLLVKPREVERWKPPEIPFVKINFDVAYNKEEHRSCSGIVVRDSKGKILGSRVIKMCVLLRFLLQRLLHVFKGFKWGWIWGLWL
ncbi:hypothetical protein Gorai_024433 [Gossypium raimondii]|uniref:RNase H type-1 domain-containing protein n=1 Tax=Gossypium raimondii TaxID=29730 RepID=A0A7J8NZV1_GOSRA|nr:hypothetical protein [Gossypium raimondii]